MTLVAELQILYTQPVRCQGCGSLNTTARLFDVTPHARGGTSQRPALSRQPHLELHCIQLNPHTTPVCHLCAHTDGAVIDREKYARWQETLAKKRDQDRVAAQPKVKKEVTLDDLI